MTDDSVILLTQAGLPPEFIANALRRPVADVKALAARTSRSRTLVPEDRELADKVRALISYAIDEAYFEIAFGAPQDRSGLLKALVARSTSLVGAESTDHLDEMRLMFEELQSGMVRDPDDHQIIDVEADE